MLICNLCDLQKLAESYAKKAQKNQPICLKGDLGSGKTTFARFFIQYFDQKAIVTSPTFTICQYHASNTIAHYDLYRLSGPEELYDLDIFDDIYNKICLIEWSDKFYFSNAIILELGVVDEHTRYII